MASYLSLRAAVAGALLGFALLPAASLHAGAPAQTQMPAPEQRLVLMGGGEAPGIAVNAFLPQAPVEIHVGGSVTWKNTWFEPHTVTFAGGTTPPSPESPEALSPSTQEANPAYTSGFLNSGFKLKDGTFTVTFPNPGTYHYLCLLHEGMTGDVVVKSAGQPIAGTQAQMDADAQAQLQSLLAKARAARQQLASAPVMSTDNGDGTRTYHVKVASDLPQTDLMLFFPETLQVNIGDTVRWETDHDAPHTVTFLGGESLPVPPAPFNPKVAAPAPPAGPYEGAGFVNSGIMMGGTPATSFSMTFGKPGSYNYLCILHVDQGMVGTIAVNATAAPVASSPAPGAPRVALPAAGAGPGHAGGAVTPYAFGLAALGAVAVGAALAARRMRRRAG